MANKNKDGSLGPANNYDIQDQYFDALGNAFNQLKLELNSAHGMRPVEDIEGLTMRFLGRPMIQLNHTKYVVGDVYTISKSDRPHASEFLDFLVTELKKRYKTLTGNPLEMTNEGEKQDLQMYSRLSPDRSWVFGMGSYQPNMCRYTLTTSRVYHVATKNLEEP